MSSLIPQCLTSFPPHHVTENDIILLFEMHQCSLWSLAPCRTQLRFESSSIFLLIQMQNLYKSYKFWKLLTLWLHTSFYVSVVLHVDVMLAFIIQNHLSFNHSKCYLALYTLSPLGMLLKNVVTSYSLEKLNWLNICHQKKQTPTT